MLMNVEFAVNHNFQRHFKYCTTKERVLSVINKHKNGNSL